MTYSFFEGEELVKAKMHRNSLNPLARLFYAYYFGVDTSAGGLSPMVSSAHVNYPQAYVRILAILLRPFD